MARSPPAQGIFLAFCVIPDGAASSSYGIVTPGVPLPVPVMRPPALDRPVNGIAREAAADVVRL